MLINAFQRKLVNTLLWFFFSHIYTNCNQWYHYETFYFNVILYHEYFPFPLFFSKITIFIGHIPYEGVSSHKYRMIHDQYEPNFQQPKKKKLLQLFNSWSNLKHGRTCNKISINIYHLFLLLFLRGRSFREKKVK